jgi:hypothetical protein
VAAHRQPTAVERDIQARIAACEGDEERVEVLRRALRFKAGWAELGEALCVVIRVESWRDWGYPSFESYCRKELHISQETAHKLTGSYAFLQSRAPEVLGGDERAPAVPSLESVLYWKRAEEDGQASREDLAALRGAVLDEGLPASALRRRFQGTFFPETEEESAERHRLTLLATARRLSHLLESTDAVPRALLRRLHEPLGELIRRLEPAPKEEDA